MQPDDVSYQMIQRNPLHKTNKNKKVDRKQLETSRRKWNSKTTKTEITSLRSSFGDSIIDQKGIANLLNYRFSKLGDYLGKKSVENQPPEGFHQNNNHFQFQAIILYTCRKYLKVPNVNNSLDPSNIPTCALKDCENDIVELLCF